MLSNEPRERVTRTGRPLGCDHGSIYTRVTRAHPRRLISNTHTIFQPKVCLKRASRGRGISRVERLLNKPEKTNIYRDGTHHRDGAHSSLVRLSVSTPCRGMVLSPGKKVRVLSSSNRKLPVHGTTVRVGLRARCYICCMGLECTYTEIGLQSCDEHTEAAVM